MSGFLIFNTSGKYFGNDCIELNLSPCKFLVDLENQLLVKENDPRHPAHTTGNI